MADPGDYVMDYDLSVEPMAALGWRAEPVNWRDADIDWDAYDAVYVCTPWDYPEHAGEFVQVVTAIDNSSALLVNPLSLIQWSLTKSYLRELDERGAAIVPSLWFDKFDSHALSESFAGLASDALVIKPSIGANAKDTFVLRAPLAASTISQLREKFTDRAFFLQPYLENIASEGEFSLFYFSGEYSHAILKTPKPGDFRSQEEHGSAINSVRACEKLRRAAENILELVEPQPVYVRADFVRDAAGEFLLMELELIEPSLYFRMDAESAMRFARAFDQYYRSQESS